MSAIFHVQMIILRHYYLEIHSNVIPLNMPLSNTTAINLIENGIHTVIVIPVYSSYSGEYSLSHSFYCSSYGSPKFIIEI